MYIYSKNKLNTASISGEEGGKFKRLEYFLALVNFYRQDYFF